MLGKIDTNGDVLLLARPGEPAFVWAYQQVAGQEHAISLSQSKWDESKHPRDDHGKWVEAMRGIAHGEMKHVGGLPVRKHADDEFRIDTDKGFVQGPAEHVADHIVDDHIKRRLMGRERHAALARAQGWTPADPFQERERANTEAEGFQRLPHGSKVVSVSPATFGRVGEVIRDESGVGRVKLEGTGELIGGEEVEPVDPSKSWRVKQKSWRETLDEDHARHAADAEKMTDAELRGAIDGLKWTQTIRGSKRPDYEVENRRYAGYANVYNKRLDAKRKIAREERKVERKESDAAMIAAQRESEQTGKYPDGRTFPKVGDEVTKTIAGAFGMPTVMRGVVGRKANGMLVVKVGGGTDMLGIGHVKKSTVPLTTSWTLKGDPVVAQRQADRREKDAQEKIQREQEQAERTKSYLAWGNLKSDLDNPSRLANHDDLKPGDVVEFWPDGGTAEIASVDDDGYPLAKDENGALYTLGNIGAMRKVEKPVEAEQPDPNEVAKLQKQVLGTQPMTQKRAYHGEVAPNGEAYPGGSFIATTTMPKRQRAVIDRSGRQKELIEPGQKWETPPVGMSPIARNVGTFFGPDGNVNYQYLQWAKHEPETVKEVEQLAEKWRAGERLVPVGEFPSLVRHSDLARMVVAGQPIPLAVLAKWPDWEGVQEKYHGKQGAPVAAEPVEPAPPEPVIERPNPGVLFTETETPVRKKKPKAEKPKPREYVDPNSTIEKDTEDFFKAPPVQGRLFMSQGRVQFPLTEENAIRLSIVHAPHTMTIHGKEFHGGQFIPGDVLAHATPEQRKEIDGGGAAAGGDHLAKWWDNKTSIERRDIIKTAGVKVHSAYEWKNIKEEDRAKLAEHGPKAEKKESVEQPAPAKEEPKHEKTEATEKPQGDDEHPKKKTEAFPMDSKFAEYLGDNRQPEKLKFRDVHEAMKGIKENYKEGLADFILRRRPELKDAINESLADMGLPLWNGGEKEPWLGGKFTKNKVYQIPTSAIHADPERFQFKMNVNKSGVTEELKEVSTFDPLFAGVVAVWKDPANDKTYIINGHHRLELAKRAGYPTLNALYIEAKDAGEARAIGALVNIVEGRGTAVDAAKFMRDKNVTVEDFKERGVSLKGKVAGDAVTLTHLNDRLFNRVARGKMDLGQALTIAEQLHDHELQDFLVEKVLAKADRDGKDVSPRTLQEMARELAETPKVKAGDKGDGSGGGLFGSADDEDSVFLEKNELKGHVRSSLTSEYNTFKFGSSKKKAARLATKGENVIDVAENAKIAEETARLRSVFDKLVNRKGKISDALNGLAVEYAKAKTKGEKDDIKQRAVEAVRGAVFQELEGTAGRGEERPPDESGEGSDIQERDGVSGRGEGESAGQTTGDRGRDQPEPSGLNPAQEEHVADIVRQVVKEEKATPAEPQAVSPDLREHEQAEKENTAPHPPTPPKRKRRTLMDAPEPLKPGQISPQDWIKQFARKPPQTAPKSIAMSTDTVGHEHKGKGPGGGQFTGHGGGGGATAGHQSKTAKTPAQQAHRQNQAQQVSKEPPAHAITHEQCADLLPPTPVLTKVVEIGKAVAGGAGSVAGGALDLEHSVKQWGMRQVMKLPTPLRLPVLGTFAAVYSTYVVAEEAAAQVAKENGLSETAQHRLASVITAVDAIGMKANFGAGMMVGGPWLGTAASFIPVASLTYLALSAGNDVLHGRWTAETSQTVQGTKKAIHSMADKIAEAKKQVRAMLGKSEVAA